MTQDETARDDRSEEPVPEDSTTLPRRQLGRYLREARQAANMTLEEVAPRMQWSPSKLSRVEKGLTPNIRVLDVEALCLIYDVDGDLRAALIGLAQQSTGKSWWHAFDDLIPRNFDLYVGLESGARNLTTFRPDMVPGLFQTPAYASALDQLYFPGITPDEIDRRLQLRARRQALLTRVTVDLVLQEAVLRTVVGGPEVMIGQLQHLTSQPTTVNVRILPFSAGFPAGIATGPFVILEFGDDPTVVYVESYAGDMYLERPTDVKRYRHAYNVIQQKALDVPSSTALLRRVIREFQSER
ncbi:helix-turn-helix domain-containing protein [Nocardia wallacei]|uniref:helix-turn-helix domain-containing protein n=1 Tax=Nocardia wallacei TaxID=480035 RepID=UPI0024549159|nr:helix-turn-helix transcriptional regulator [Nocardia wallacei]